MSGGSLDYVYSKVEDAARAVRGLSPLHRAFAEHLMLVAKALHDCEWVISCDYGTGDDEAAIRKVIAPGADAKAAADTLREEIERARKVLDQMGAKP